MSTASIAKTKKTIIKVAARSSALSLKQVEEIYAGLKFHHPNILFHLRCCLSNGDIDQTTSLKNLDNTDFFTHEIDQLVIKGECDIAIHSAKDLPKPLPDELEVIALTESKEEKDVLVLKEGLSLKVLPESPVIATSSKRREENVLKVLPTAQFVDLRGTIEKRLAKLNDPKVDGVVIAKVALMRLNLMSVNWIDMPGAVAEGQGSLAIVSRKDNQLMKELFSSIDYRRGKKCLFFGLNPNSFLTAGPITHLPLIETKPIKNQPSMTLLAKLRQSTHIVLTSKNAVYYFLKLLEEANINLESLKFKSWVVIGERTKEALLERGIVANHVALNESQEGLIELFKPIKPGNIFVLLPRSSLSRSNLINFLHQSKIQYYAFDLYVTRSVKVVQCVNLEEFSEVVFTSSSCVNSFFENFGSFPDNLKAVFQGRITRDSFEKKLNNQNIYLNHFK